MHKAGLFKKINKKKVYSKSEGIIFNKEVIQHIIDFETELVANKYKRFVNNTSIEIDKREDLI